MKEINELIEEFENRFKGIGQQSNDAYYIFPTDEASGIEKELYNKWAKDILEKLKQLEQPTKTLEELGWVKAYEDEENTRYEKGHGICEEYIWLYHDGKVATCTRLNKEELQAIINMME